MAQGWRTTSSLNFELVRLWGRGKGEGGEGRLSHRGAGTRQLAGVVTLQNKDNGQLHKFFAFGDSNCGHCNIIGSIRII